MTLPFPNSPTGTTGLQKAFTIAIRKRFRLSLRKIYEHLNTHKERLQESIMIKEAITPNSMTIINGILENLKLDLSPIIKTYIGAVWWKANKKMAGVMNLGQWVPFDKRVVKILQDDTYSYLDTFINEKQKELKYILQTSISQGDTVSTIGNYIKDSFKTTSWKSELIARSETVRVYGISSKMAIKNGGVTYEYKWLTSLKENVCPICRPLHGKIFNINDKNAPMPVTDTHPQCNCGIVPHVKI